LLHTGEECSGLQQLDTPLGEFNTAFWILIAVQSWVRIGFNLLIYSSSMLTIAPEIYKSAAIDGASGWDNLFRITMLLTRNVINLTIVSAVPGVFQLFGMAWMLSGAGTVGGGPMNTTHLLATYKPDCAPHWESPEFVSWAGYKAFFSQFVRWLAKDG
jgi:raffinose/stachyose/melibiose transport system permease protein